MAKDTFYFSHDYGARNDPKLQRVLMKMGHEGKGIFWDIIEMMFEQDGYLMRSHCESYAFALRTDLKKIESLIKDFNLFEYDEERFWSNSVLIRLEKKDVKSKKASDSARKRWEYANASKINANASKNDAIKEKKGEKGNKEKINNKKVSTETAVSDGIYPECFRLYDEFLKEKTGVGANFSPASGAAMNKIIAYLKTQITNKDDFQKEIPRAFEYIFKNYKKWDLYHQKQLKLNQIESNLINILNSIRNGTPQQKSRFDTIRDAEKDFIITKYGPQ